MSKFEEDPEKQQNLDEAKEEESLLTRADIAVVQATEAYAESPPVEILGTASEITDQPPLIALSAGTKLLGAIRRDGRLARTGLRMLASHAAATAIKTLVKNEVDRPRPYQAADEGDHRVERGDADGHRSLPSGHTAGAVAVARAAGRDYPAAAPWLMGAAAIASLVQVPRHAHYPSDVVVGAAVGLVAEAAVDRLIASLRDEGVASEAFRSPR